MRITNTKVYGLVESVCAAGYPVGKSDYSESRAKRLGSVPAGSGHDCFLKGVVVQADITAPQYWWLQWQRYHFHDIISSESKMYGILKMNIDVQCNEYVDAPVKEHLKSLLAAWNNIDIYLDEKDKKDLFQRIIANTPMGLMLKARITTNYLQLKTIWLQRKNHKLQEWQVFCDWIEGLPRFKKIVLQEGALG